MKKIISLTALLSAITFTPANAQFYLRGGLGYAMPAAGQTVDGEGLHYNGNASTSSNFSVKNASFGAGLHGLIGMGYMFNKNVGIQLDAALGLVPKKYTYSMDSAVVSSIPSSVTFTNQASGPVILMPSLVLQTDGDTWNIYCRLGLALPLNTQITQDQVLTNLPGTGATEIDDFQFKITNSFSLGYSAAAGVAYKFSDRVSVWGEMSILSLSAYVKQEDLTIYVDNQPLDPSSYGNIARTYYYSKSGTIDSNGVHNATFSQPFSNVGFTFGIKFNLSDPPRHHSAAKHVDSFN